MTNKETETALKLCSEGANANCRKCPYLEKGCIKSLVRNSLRYIEQLNVQARSARSTKDRGEQA